MTSQLKVTQADAELFFRAACCLIAADGKVRSQEISVLSEAMSNLGFHYSPDKLRTLAMAVCKDLHRTGVDAQSEAIANQLSRFRNKSAGSLFQQTLASLARRDGEEADAGQRIAARFRAALELPRSSERSLPQASHQSAHVKSSPVAAQPSAQKLTALHVVHQLDWKWILPICLAFLVLGWIRTAFFAAANNGKPQPNPVLLAEASAAQVPDAQPPNSPRTTKPLTVPHANKTLTVPQAEALVRRGGWGLLLNDLTELSPAVADVLAKFRGVVALDGLKVLSPEVARALAMHTDGLSLDGLTSLSTATARELTKMESGGGLGLDGLANLSVDVAELLAIAKIYSISLDGLKTVPKPVALALAKKNGGELTLDGLTDLPVDVAAILANAKIEIVSLNGLKTVSEPVALALAKKSKGVIHLEGVSALSSQEAKALACYDGLLKASDAVSSAVAKERLLAKSPAAQALGEPKETPLLAPKPSEPPRVRTESKVELAGISLGMAEDKLLNVFEGVASTKIDMTLCPRFSAYVTPESRTNVACMERDVVKDWTDADIVNHQAGYKKLLASFPAWLGDPMTPGSFASRYAHRTTDWRDHLDGPPPPWRFILFAGGPKGTEGICFTEVKYHDDHGVISVYFRYKEGIKAEVVEAAIESKFGPSSSKLAIERGIITERTRRNEYRTREGVVNMSLGNLTWMPSQGVEISLSRGIYVPVDVTMTDDALLQQINRAVFSARLEREKSKKQAAGSQLGL